MGNRFQFIRLLKTRHVCYIEEKGVGEDKPKKANCAQIGPEDDRVYGRVRKPQKGLPNDFF